MLKLMNRVKGNIFRFLSMQLDRHGYFIIKDGPYLFAIGQLDHLFHFGSADFEKEELLYMDGNIMKPHMKTFRREVAYKKIV